MTEAPLLLRIDGRFLGQPLTGVQRYAREWVSALDGLLAAGDPAAAGVVAEVLTPPSLAASAPEWRAIAVRGVGFGGGHAWEQVVLPLAVGKAVLFCPGNAAPLVSLLGGQRVAVTLHGLSFLDRPGSYARSFRALYGLLARAALRYADAVLTVSEAERRALRARYPGLPDRIHVVANGAAPRAFHEILAKAPPVVPRPAEPAGGGAGELLFVGSLTEGKNLQAALDALEIVRRRHDVGLVVVGAVGPGLARSGLRIPASCAERVAFAGQVDDPERLVDFYRRARCLVFPSRYESSGLPPTEAMTCGCPAVVSDLPALRERCGDAALYCDAGDPHAIAARVLEVLEDRERAEALQRAGLRRAETLRWEENVRRTLGILRHVARAG